MARLTPTSDAVGLRIRALKQRASGRVHKTKTARIQGEQLAALVQAAAKDKTKRANVRQFVRAAIKRKHGAFVHSDAPVGELIITRGYFTIKAFVLGSSLAKLDGACQFCKDLRNVEVEGGIVTRLFCDSCLIQQSKAHPCPGVGPSAGKCGMPLWMSPLGLPSALCPSCDACAAAASKARA